VTPSLPGEVVKTGDGGPTTEEENKGLKPGRGRGAVRKGKSWAGYGWFMSLGTILPLVVFIAGYVVNVTLVGAPLARRIYRFGIWLATLGQEPPGQDKLEARMEAKKAKDDADKALGKKSLLDRVRHYSPPELIERRGRPVGMPVRVVWFVLVGWWLGVIWVMVSWGLFLLPYPMLDAVAALLAKLPSVMTLAWPDSAQSGNVARLEVAASPE
jgi:uncharacterized membrane protein YccF (DUF307 family)